MYTYSVLVELHKHNEIKQFNFNNVQMGFKNNIP